MTTRVRESLSVLLPDNAQDAPRVSYPAPLRHSEIGIASSFIGGIVWASLIWGFIDLVVMMNRPPSGMMWSIVGNCWHLYHRLFFLSFTGALIGLGTGIVGEFKSAGKKRTTCHIGVVLNALGLAVSFAAIESCPPNMYL